MRTSVFALLIFSASAGCANKEFDQCGGSEFSGADCCPDNDDCVIINGYYSQCQPKDLCPVPQYGQCGGTDHSGKPWDPKKTCCPGSFECIETSEYYSQCLPVDSISTVVFSASAGCTNKEFDQCGGSEFSGADCCPDNDDCVIINGYYSQCQPKDLCLVPQYGQCGGTDHSGKPWDPKKTCCPSSFECIETSEYYSQCLPVDSISTVVFSASAGCTNKEFDQCGGGSEFSGADCCPDNDDCVIINGYYSQCQPKDLCLVPQYGQCGGTDHSGKPWDPKKTCCPGSFECKETSEYYSQCLPLDSNSTVCAGAWKQCGGKDQDGNDWGRSPDEKTCCITGYECMEIDPIYYSQCEPIKICSNPRYGQCGGMDRSGKPWSENNGNCCPGGFECVVQDQYYSQCKPKASFTVV